METINIMKLNGEHSKIYASHAKINSKFNLKTEDRCQHILAHVKKFKK